MFLFGPVVRPRHLACGLLLCSRPVLAADGGVLAGVDLPVLALGAVLLAGLVLSLVGRLRRVANGESEGRFRALVEQSLAGIYIMQDDRLVYANAKVAEMLGFDLAELAGKPLAELLEPDEFDRIRAQIRRRFAENIVEMRYSLRMRRKDGSASYAEVHSRLIHHQGKPAVIGIVLDINERLLTDGKLKLAATVFDNSTEGILLTDADARIIAVNRAFTAITGYTENDVLGRKSRLFRIDHMGQAINEQMMQGLAQEGRWQGEYLDRRRDHSIYPVWLSISAVQDDDGQLSHYVCVFSDMTMRRESEDRLQFLSTHDALTRLPNRLEFIKRLDTTIEHAYRDGKSFAVMFIDLDRFKLINDSFGHQAGDDLLRVIAARLSYAVGDRGLLSRPGGDEFTVLFHHDGDQTLLELMADRLLNELTQPLRMEEHDLFVTGSIGIATYPADGCDSHSLLKHADVAMYRAKESGKNTYTCFAAEMNVEAIGRLTLESGLRSALANNQLELYYQPQINPVSNAMEGLEALLRWHHPELGMVSPARFIPVAEETGLIRSIGQWVLAEACRQLAQWDAEGQTIPRVSVNLSARQFVQKDLVAQVKEALTDTGIAPGRLELEVTESTLMVDPVGAIAILDELKTLGVKLSIDDFGTGYSSLSNLKRFPLDTLKVDRSFIEGIPADSEDVAITEAIVAMAKKLSLHVVAEGVETEAQREFIELCGCELIQGYFYSKPLPAGAIPKFAARHKFTPEPLVAQR